MTEYYLDDSKVHAFWDKTLEPRLEINPGDTVAFECREASDNQVTPDWISEDLRNLDFKPMHPLTGPVYIKGAEPGDTLEVEIIDLVHKGWGWTATIPGFGLLADDFPEPFLHHWRLENETCYFKKGSGIEVPFEPFCGVMGLAPQNSGRIDTIPPRANAGNIDICSLIPGTKVWFPVWASGALFSTGDCHAAQGDGEVCGTAIESPMIATLRFNVRKGVKVDELQFQTSRALTRTNSKGSFVTTAHGPDLISNAQNAIRYMIDHLSESYGLTREESYLLCSVVVDLKISEIVDAPNWIVSAYLPLGIFRGSSS